MWCMCKVVVLPTWTYCSLTSPLSLLKLPSKGGTRAILKCEFVGLMAVLFQFLGVTWLNDCEKGSRLSFYTWTYWMHWYNIILMLFFLLLFAKVKHLLQWVMLLPMLSQKLEMFWKCFALISLSIFSLENCKVKPWFNKPLCPPYNM